MLKLARRASPQWFKFLKDELGADAHELDQFRVG